MIRLQTPSVSRAEMEATILQEVDIQTSLRITGANRCIPRHLEEICRTQEDLERCISPSGPISTVLLQVCLLVLMKVRGTAALHIFEESEGRRTSPVDLVALRS